MRKIMLIMLSTQLGFYVVDNFLFYSDVNGVMLFDVCLVKVLHKIKRLKEYLNNPINIML